MELKGRGGGTDDKQIGVGETRMDLGGTFEGLERWERGGDPRAGCGDAKSLGSKGAGKMGLSGFMMKYVFCKCTCEEVACCSEDTPRRACELMGHRYVRLWIGT